MTISNDLFLSILSMDAYNRGYHPGIAGLSDAVDTQIGNAKVVRASDSRPSSPEVAASFYAISYTVGAGVDGISPGTTVISYRGTDEQGKELAPVDLPITSGRSRAVGCVLARTTFSTPRASPAPLHPVLHG